MSEDMVPRHTVRLTWCPACRKRRPVTWCRVTWCPFTSCPFHVVPRHVVRLTWCPASALQAVPRHVVPLHVVPLHAETTARKQETKDAGRSAPALRESSDTPARSGEVSNTGALLPRQQARTNYELGGPRLPLRDAVRAGPTPESERSSCLPLPEEAIKLDQRGEAPPPAYLRMSRASNSFAPALSTLHCVPENCYYNNK